MNLTVTRINTYSRGSIKIHEILNFLSLKLNHYTVSRNLIMKEFFEICSEVCDRLGTANTCGVQGFLHMHVAFVLMFYN